MDFQTHLREQHLITRQLVEKQSKINTTKLLQQKVFAVKIY